MVRAIWNGTGVAESADTVIVEGNHYFPKDSVRWELPASSDTHTTCPWKGIASYYSIRVGDKINRDAAWTYPAPSEAALAHGIKDRVAFCKGVTVEE